MGKELAFSCGSFLKIDPRTKMMVFICCSFAALKETRWLFQGFLFALAFLLLINGKQYKYGMKMLCIYVLFLGLDILVAGKATGILLITVFAVCRITRMFLPVYMVFMLMMKTTRVSEFIAAFDRMHFPDEITIPFSVMFRFFPMMWEEWENIQNAMKFRGLSFSVKNIFTRPMQVYECAMVPLLADAVMIADELSAASLSRGLGADTKRTCITEVKIGFVDVVVMIIAIGLNISSAFAF
ncbi:MAG: energy-coupling factor transporter transmembrane protein EcfT [Lachnospiraceae bacterium]|nr:energy-coupling factor transporter transmembrane protein EcfT [Lachnospiraceae bacterium]